jgi:hypothetical protein
MERLLWGSDLNYATDEIQRKTVAQHCLDKDAERQDVDPDHGAFAVSCAAQP